MLQLKKSLAAIALAAAAATGAQATSLNTGDISFTGWTAGWFYGFYGYTFASWVDIAPGTEIYITDMSWKGTSSNKGWNRSDSVEGLYKWTVGSAGVTAGQSFFAALYTDPSTAYYVPTGVYSNLPTISATSTCSITDSGCRVSGGTTNGSFVIQNNTGLTAGGVYGHNGMTSYTGISSVESMYIYQGGTQAGETISGTAFTIPQITTLIAAAENHAASNGDNIVGGSSYVAGTPYGALDAGDNFVNLDHGKTWAYYTGPRTGKTAAEFKALLTDPANWVTEDVTTPQNFANGYVDSNTGFSVVAVPEASSYAMLLAGLGIIGMNLRRRTRA